MSDFKFNDNSLVKLFSGNPKKFLGVYEYDGKYILEKIVTLFPEKKVFLAPHGFFTYDDPQTLFDNQELMICDIVIIDDDSLTIQQKNSKIKMLTSGDKALTSNHDYILDKLVICVLDVDHEFDKATLIREMN